MTKVSQILVSHLESYLEPGRTSQWSFFSKILNVFKLETIFAKKTQSQMLDWLNIDFWLTARNIELTLVASLQIKPKKYSIGKHV